MVVSTELKITPTEYLEREKTATERTEFIDGQLFPMAGASANHNQLTSKLTGFLTVGLDDEIFDVFVSDMRVWLQETESYVYPDLVVSKCPSVFIDDSQMELTNPCFIAEVLSPSTARYDKKAKFDLYKTIPTLEEYLILPQNQQKIELYRRLQQNQWLLTEFEIDDSPIMLESLNLEISLPKLYKKVIF
ncbi:protein of unknown function DUF820 [[Leptolyngbya] sp. PCC 7376]|uniref:Uma2 family endonuclease n=1 Tax=[Leptolyngbya] sp. PCC 7376 TaxID=111781 RepID=UPI00029ED115|nr:Uma2 family endonuclease [[Leptolyngbya] sp. PCC 7376]AFY36846.1 protein of unknown function DUF820 [[Leptolyngbya] sp. PCC 7376]